MKRRLCQRWRHPLSEREKALEERLVAEAAGVGRAAVGRAKLVVNAALVVRHVRNVLLEHDAVEAELAGKVRPP